MLDTHWSYLIGAPINLSLKEVGMPSQSHLILLFPLFLPLTSSEVGCDHWILHILRSLQMLHCDCHHYFTTGKTRPMDCFSIKRFPQTRADAAALKLSPRYGFLEVMWGLVADIDLGSESLRWLGPIRLTVAAIIRCLKLRKYSGRLHYLPATENKQKNTQLLFSEPLGAVPSKFPDAWKSVEGSFIYFMAMNMPWCASDFLCAPRARLSDGTLDLIWIEDCKHSQLINILLNAESGTYIKKPFVYSCKVHAFVLEPGTRSTPSGKRDGLLDVDGEIEPQGSILVECIPSCFQVFAPAHLNEEKWFVD